ncbi:hypothetical protein BC937DRAFT_95110 [Endogone sp. FLAS-F59071]|nr:hypothetical protein BC937DRAFT_95110 [Endogone sp. FLAS-F59071]|eukprot:RUS13572.1 hypothetical protein BC937DRAFT_95110 [Endogone sp. FLAS-F59071]
MPLIRSRLLPLLLTSSSSLSSRLTPTSTLRLRLFTSMADAIESGKRIAAYQAVDEYILPSHKAVGIGSGSTVVYAVERILQRPELRHIVFIPTSFQSKILIVDGGLKLGTIEQCVHGS